MDDPHRVRRLRWQARAPGAAEAFALRSLLREQGDACQAALDRAFDNAAPPGEVWRLPRLELTIRVAELGHLTAAGLADRVEAALREALNRARQAEPDAPVPAAGARQRTAPAIELRLAFQHYLSHGLLPWTQAGLAPEQAQRALREAAVQAAESVLAGAETLDAVLALPAARADAHADARIGALLRWLALLPASLRRRWVAATAAGAVPAALADARTVEAWKAWIDADAADRIEWQALWLAGPLDVDVLRTRLESRPPPAGDAPPFLPSLRQALAPAAGPAAPGAEPGAPATSPPAPATRTPSSWAAPDDAATQSLLVPMAGLVLLHPWLPRFLAGCGVLDGPGRQVAQLPRACALLHALACGDAAPAEFELPFVKLLLGHPPDEPLTEALPAVTPGDREEIAALLGAVREHWSALRGTGTDGLRLSFLQRRGLLTQGDAAWQLRMQGEPFDMLLGLLPWPIGLVRLPWMPGPLAVEWPTP